MRPVYAKVVQKLVENKMREFVLEALSLTQQGFNVCLRCADEVLLQAFVQVATPLATKKGVTLFPNAQEFEGHLHTRPLPRGFILATAKVPPRGMGLVNFSLPSLESILPPTTTVIAVALDQLALTSFMDCFDARRTAEVRRLIAKFGLEFAIDVIAEIALRAGFHGDENLVENYLAGLLDHNQTQDTREALEFPVERFFKRILAETQQPHGLLKAALSYYVVKVRGTTMTLASRSLNISRTTLLEHLRLAERYNVASLFQQKQENESNSEPPRERLRPSLN